MTERHLYPDQVWQSDQGVNYNTTNKQTNWTIQAL